jgi:hypothetical protein
LRISVALGAVSFCGEMSISTSAKQAEISVTDRLGNENTCLPAIVSLVSSFLSLSDDQFNVGDDLVLHALSW